MKYYQIVLLLLIVPSVIAADGDTNSVSKLWNNVEIGDELVAEFRVPGLSLRDISLTFTDRADPAKIEIKGRSTKPVLAPESKMARIYQYVDITSNIESRAIVSDVLFYVPREWVDSLTIENPQIALEYRVDNNWTQVNITIVPSEDWFEVHASVPMIEDFVIGANRPSPIEVIEPEITPVLEEEVVEVPVVNDTDENTSVVIPVIPEETDEPFKIPTWVWIVLGAVILLALLFVGFEAAARKRSREFK